MNKKSFFALFIFLYLIIQVSTAVFAVPDSRTDQIVPVIGTQPDIHPGHQAVMPSGSYNTIPSKTSVGVSPVDSPGIVSGGCPECFSPVKVAPDNQTTDLQTLSVSDEQAKIDAINAYIQENDLEWVAGKNIGIQPDR